MEQNNKAKNNRMLLDSLKIEIKHLEHLTCAEKCALWARIEKDNLVVLKAKRNKRRLISLFTLLSGITATVVIFLILNFFQHHIDNNKTLTSVAIQNMEMQELNNSNIQLIISENQTVLSEINDLEITYNSSSVVLADKNDSHIRQKITHSIDEPIYNQLIVPFGKRSVLNLADGSRIWVNAGTRMIYPVMFLDDKREIFVEGEIYLEVAYNEEKPFVVKTKKMEAIVLGTSFNVMAYESDEEQCIVLVEGKVKVQSGKEEALLAPNQMFDANKGVVHLTNLEVNEYISWKDGIYQYRSETLDVIAKRLSRYYGQEIYCKNRSLTSKMFRQTGFEGRFRTSFARNCQNYFVSLNKRRKFLLYNILKY